MTFDEHHIGELLSAYEACWNERRFFDLRKLWRDDDEAPIWLPEEVNAPLTNWSAVNAYLKASDELIPRFAVRTWDHIFKPVAAGVVCGVWKLHWNADTWFGNPPRRRAIGGDVKASATFREVAPADWRFVHYHEAALGPLPFVRRAYEAQVDPAFRVDTDGMAR